MSTLAYRRPGSRGIAIAVALLVLMIISVIGLAIASIGTQDLNLATADRNYSVCRFAAEAAVAEGVSMLVNNPAWEAGIASRTLTNVPGVNVTCTLTVTNNYQTTGSNRTATDGTVVPPGTVYLFATGQIANTVYTKSAGVLYYVSPNPIFKYAAFGGNAVTLQGTSSLADSYDSSHGSYSATVSQSNSDVGTNSTATGAVTYKGGAINYGTTYAGYGGTASQVVDGDVGTNCQAVAVLPAPVVLPTPISPLIASSSDYPASGSTLTMVPGSYQDLTTGTHTTVNFTAGVYCFRNVEFGSQNIINLSSSGKVIIYISGSWDSQGGAFVNPQGKAENFQLLGTATCTTIDVTGNNGAYFVVNAPTANVTVQGNGDVFGAVVGKTVTIAGNGKVHYDVDLRNMHGHQAVVSPRFWKRL